MSRKAARPDLRLVPQIEPDDTTPSGWSLAYEEPLVRLYRGDCREVLPMFAADSVDHVICDPPYSKKVHEASRRKVMDLQTDGSHAAAMRNADLGFEHLSTSLRKCIAQAIARLAKGYSLIFTDYEGIPGWTKDIEKAGLELVQICHWRKLNPPPQFTGDRPAQGCEAILAVHRPPPGRKVWNGGGKAGTYSHAIVLNRGGKNARFHETQKPLPLMLELVADFTAPGSTVLDMTSGSGTTLLACKNSGRNSIGIANRAKDVRATVARLRQEILPFGDDECAAGEEIIDAV